MLDQVRLDLALRVDAVRMLGRHEHPLDLDRPLDPVLVDLVAHGHLRLAVRAQIRSSPARRTSASCLQILWASVIGRGISSSVSRHA